MNRFVVPALVFISLFSSFSFAQSLSEKALYARCYSHLTGKPVPLGNAVMAQIKAGTMKALDACNLLLDKAELDPGNGVLTLRNDREARDVLNNFNSFHRSWFTANTVEQIQDNNNETSDGTMDLYDSTEPALALTRALFARNGQYSDVVTLNTGVHGIREDQPMASKLGFNWSVTYPGRRVFGNNANLESNVFAFMPINGAWTGDINTSASIKVAAPRIELGELVGVRPTTESFNVPNVTMVAFADRRGNLEPGLNFSFDLFKTLGGGTLGSPVYMMLNYGHGKGTPATGSLKVPRRWAQTNMTTFLCATLPALRESDVAQFVVGNSTAPFRNATSCVMCHANLDQMAYTARNIVTTNSDFARMTDVQPETTKTSTLWTTYRAEFPSVAGWPSEPVANFHRQTPSGKLYFRSFSGKLVNQDVMGVGGLGAAFAQTDDYYQCAAKRYFEYFTGITVPLYDRTDPKNADLNKALSAAAINDRKFVEELGADLKQNQSVRSIIKKIMSSSYYRAANYRP